MCSEGFHNCGVNETCNTDSSTQSFSCSGSDKAVMSSPYPSPSPSVVDAMSSLLLSSSMVVSSIPMSSSPVISASIIETESSNEFFQSSAPHGYSSSAELVQTDYLTTSVNSTTVGPYSTAVVSPSPSPITALPEECAGEFCLTTQNCSLVCDCPRCICADGWSWSGSSSTGNCIMASFGQNVCSDDGFIGLKWPSVTAGSVISIPCCSFGQKCE